MFCAVQRMTLKFGGRLLASLLRHVEQTLMRVLLRLVSFRVGNVGGERTRLLFLFQSRESLIRPNPILISRLVIAPTACSLNVSQLRKTVKSRAAKKGRSLTRRRPVATGSGDSGRPVEQRFHHLRFPSDCLSMGWLDCRRP